MENIAECVGNLPCNGYSFDNGNGTGYGFGDGSGYGYGNGGGDICKASSINGHKVFTIDGLATLIYKAKENIAKGVIVKQDLSFTPCYIVKNENFTAHGKTLKEAMEALREKEFEDMPEDKRIALFMECHELGKTYATMNFFSWHKKLTGSCLMGREAFAKNNDVDLEGEMSVQQFIDLTRKAYGGGTIVKLEEEYAKA